jgi:glutaredoxin 3
MNHILFVIPFVAVLSNCSGIAPEAERDESNSLLKPPFLKTGAKVQKAVVEMYSKPRCPHCIKAKALFDSKKIAYKEYDVTNNPSLAQESIDRSGGRRVVPQIFINGKHVGGHVELQALSDSGELAKLLAE